MHWPPETDGEKKERESILGEGLDGPTEGRTGPAAECHSILCLYFSFQSRIFRQHASKDGSIFFIILL